MMYWYDPAARFSSCVAIHPSCWASSDCPGVDQPSQLPMTCTASFVLAGWYQTVSEHERSGTDEAGVLP